VDFRPIFSFKLHYINIRFEDGTKKVTTSKISDTGISKVNIALTVGFGIDYSQFERLHIRIEPI